MQSTHRRSIQLIVCGAFVAAVAAIGACALDVSGSLSADGGAEDATTGDASESEGKTPGEDATAEGDALVAGDGAALDGGNADGSLPDAPPLDANPDVSDGAPDGDAAPLTFVCSGSAPVTDCASCSGKPLPCMMCSTTPGNAPYTVCVPKGSSCYSSYRPAGYTYCKCPSTLDASVCPLSAQGCNPFNNGVCVTCGELGTQGDHCKTGGLCSESLATCQ